MRLLKVTKAGLAFLKKPVSFKIVEDNDFEEIEEEVPMKEGPHVLSIPHYIRY